MAVYIADHLQFKLINIENSSNIEALSFEPTPPKSKTTLFGSLCRPPNSDASVSLKRLTSMSTNYSTDDKEIIKPFFWGTLISTSPFKFVWPSTKNKDRFAYNQSSI